MSRTNTAVDRRMVVTFFVLISLLVGPLTSCQWLHGGNSLPDDVKQFKTSRDLCDHYRGEESNDAERRKFLQEQMKIHCTGADEKLRALKLKYENNSTVLKSLAKYQERIE